MNKTFAITTIVLVAVIMGMSSVVPVYAAHFNCPGPWIEITNEGAVGLGADPPPDKNGNGWVCWKMVGGDKIKFKDDIKA